MWKMENEIAVCRETLPPYGIYNIHSFGLFNEGGTCTWKGYFLFNLKPYSMQESELLSTSYNSWDISICSEGQTSIMEMILK